MNNEWNSATDLQWPTEENAAHEAIFMLQPTLSTRGQQSIINTPTTACTATQPPFLKAIFKKQTLDGI